MTLYIGRHMVGMNQKRDPQTYQPVEPAAWEAAASDSESSVEFEIVSLGPPFQTRGADGEFAHEEQMVLLRKVR